MFRELRRKDRGLDNPQTEKLLEDGLYGVLSTVGENGYAYGIPLNYVYLNGAIYFHCAGEGHKLDNMSFNNKVSFCVVADSETIPEKFSCRYKSAVAFGTAEEAFGNEKIEALMGFIRKYSPDFIESGTKYVQNSADITKVYKINIDHMSGKARL